MVIELLTQQFDMYTTLFYMLYSEQEREVVIVSFRYKVFVSKKKVELGLVIESKPIKKDKK